MKTPTLVLTLALAAWSLAAVPTTQAVEDSPCLVGDHTCFVGIEWHVCVTDPCDPPLVCANHGTICVRLGLP